MNNCSLSSVFSAAGWLSLHCAPHTAAPHLTQESPPNSEDAPEGGVKETQPHAGFHSERLAALEETTSSITNTSFIFFTRTEFADLWLRGLFLLNDLLTIRRCNTQSFIHVAQLCHVWGWIGQRLPCVCQERLRSPFHICWLIPNYDTDYSSYIKSTKASVCVHSQYSLMAAHPYHLCCASWQENKYSWWWRQGCFHQDTLEQLRKPASQTVTPIKRIKACFTIFQMY